MDARKDIAFLVGSESREAILDALATEPRRPTELATVCGCARETAQRTLAGFCDRNWVEKHAEKYRLTPGGRMVYEQYVELVGTVTQVDLTSEFLTNATGPIAGVPQSVLEQVTVTTAVGGDPHAPLNRYLTVLGDEPVDEFRGISPIVSRVFNEAAERVIGPGTRMELIIDSEVLQRSMDSYPDALEQAHELEQFTLRVSEESIDFGLLLVDEHALVAAYDGDGNMVALIDGDEPAVLEWAQSVYDAVSANATAIEALGPNA
ncbi:helix-turn-helix transcriptional regulator [Haloferax namakaokahaiae]|uniref:Helix-turn-helix transcriptional regulator n=1 Tax=Haloferax namakaokahaiae TaxID=1748331 RepID=A0ABD5ZEE4_9EURY